MNNLDAIQLDHVNLLDVHRAALAQYEQDAAECDANNEPYTAQLFREAAERRRKLIDATEKRRALENLQHGKEQQNEGDNPSQQQQNIRLG